MIANDIFASTFGLVAPDGGDDLLEREERKSRPLVYIARAAARNGFAVVFNEPGSKKPLAVPSACPLSAAARKAADTVAQDAAREAGDDRWASRRHKCALGHAFTDPAEAGSVAERMIKRHGHINLGLHVGRSRLLCVDVDTAAEKAAFLAAWSEATGQNMADRSPTVVSPGKVRVDADGEERWVHKDGGHYWFTLPEGVELAALPGPGILTGDGGWVAIWGDKQVLVPPSVRAEGAYHLVGQVEEAPRWLLDRIEMMARAHVERQRIQRDRVRYADDPIDGWSCDTSWADLLVPDGWTDTGLPDSCDCPIFTRPGDASTFKSATGHQLGCSKYDLSQGHGPLHLWTDNPPEFLHNAGKTITKLQYVALRDHGGDARAAMSALGLAALGGGLLDTLNVTSAAEKAVEASAVAGAAQDTPEPVSVAQTGVQAAVEEMWPDELRAIKAELLAAGLPMKLRNLVEDQAAMDWAREEFRQLKNRSQVHDIRTRMRLAIDRLADVTEDDEVDLWRIDGLWMQDQVVMLTAQWKAGKTTMVTNIVRSLVDGAPFLGRFETTPVDGAVFIVNAEMTRRQFNRWLFESPIERRDLVYAFHVREAGPSSGDILDPTRRDELVAMLNEVGAKVLIMDPLNPLISAAGLDENASTDVAKWFTALADIQERTSVREVFLVHHFGHNGQRGRGSSKFMDAPDALWTYTIDGEDPEVGEDTEESLLGEIEKQAAPRYLQAVGRDVDLPKTQVTFDKSTRTLSMQDGGGPLMGKKAMAEQKHKRELAVKVRQIVKEVADRPGIGSNALLGVVRGNKALFEAARDEAIRTGQIRTVQGARNSMLMYPVTDSPTETTETD